MKARQVQSRSRNDRGAVAVEFALVTVFALIPLLLGMIQFAFVFQAKITVNQAARAGARLAAICGSACSPTVSASTISAAPGLDPARLSVSVNYCPGGTSCSSGYCPANATQSTGSAQVVVNYIDDLSFVILPAGKGPNLTIVGKASMPCGG